MISTNFNREEYQSRRLSKAIEEGQEFVPDGDGEKWYTVVCANGEDWKYIHDRIVENDCDEDNIPTPHRDCVDESKSCSRMGSFLLNDAEAEDLKNHPKVLDIELDPNHYEGTFKGVEDRPRYNFIDKFDSNVSIGRDFTTSFFPTTPGSNLLSRTGASIWRHSYKDDPWDGISDLTILSGNPQVLGDGTDVDVIVCDESAWYGHIEFIKTGVGEPKNFVGGNVLREGFAPSATTGVCGVLDMVLDTPYYLDPDFFEADPVNRLTMRWDGTTVPVESVARDWWRNESTTYRSAKYVGTNSGGTAIIGSAEDFGTISVNTSQTRANSNGSNTAQHNSGGYHGTPCMSQAYGKTHGFAYNSNKWHMSIIWRTGSQTISNMFRILKVFHQLKPNRTSDNTKNPTITSHSWGRIYGFSDGYYFYRTTSNGVSFTTSAKPAFLNNFYGVNEHEKWERQTGSETVLGHEMLDAGVIFLSAAGNNNQKQVLPTHPDYDNYHGSSSSYSLATAEYNGRMTHRPGFPSSIGYVSNYMGTGQGGYRTFNIGALDSNKSSTTQERKASYSNMGNAIDCYAIGADSLSATDDNTSTRYNRYDDYYQIDSNYNIVTSGGTQSDDSQDRQFGGTSSACPVTCGLMATKLQFFRDWTWENIKTWLAESVENQGSTKFFTGTEAVTATDTNYNSDYNLQGADSKIIYDALSGDEPSEKIRASVSGGIYETIGLESWTKTHNASILFTQALDDTTGNGNQATWLQEYVNSIKAISANATATVTTVPTGGHAAFTSNATLQAAIRNFVGSTNPGGAITNQQFTIVPTDGETHTVDGTSYPVMGKLYVPTGLAASSIDVVVVFHGTVSSGTIQAASETALTQFLNTSGLNCRDLIIFSAAYPQDHISQSDQYNLTGVGTEQADFLMGDNLPYARAAVGWVKNSLNAYIAAQGGSKTITNVYLFGHSQGGKLVAKMNTLEGGIAGVVSNAPGPIQFDRTCAYDGSNTSCSKVSAIHGTPGGSLTITGVNLKIV